jgi:hypothetical protein
MTSSIKTALVALGASFLFSFTEQTTSNGQVTSFVDYGAIVGSVAALFLCAAAMREASSPLSGDKRTPQMAIIGVMTLVAAYRLAYGLGMFV